ncbi:MAG TPA: cob(I)yrinic acid a,c-diamide adenosyltransferase [Thermoplasmata archaeon]|nr:cob(I)yrinic acid a,c-diamide adenosyltransferase [Thermoplasmata archaeon]
MATGDESIPRLYTRTGDRGTTGLAGGARVDKDSARIRAYGTLDELGAQLGVVESELPDALGEMRAEVRRLEHELFVAQSELAAAPGTKGPPARIEARHVERLEADIDRFDALHPELRTFVLCRGARPAAALHVARTVARRAERELWTLHRTEPQRPELLQWANRLSDLLFALALATNHALGVAEVPPDYST